MKNKQKKKEQSADQLEIIDTKDFFDRTVLGVIRFYTDHYICGNFYKSCWAVNIAWLHQEDAIAQRERLKQERQAVREQRAEPVSAVSEENEITPEENIEPAQSECDDFEEYEEDEEIGMEISM